MNGITPNEARDLIGDWEAGELSGEDSLRALATLAAMRVEHDYRVVTWEEVDGRYEVYHRTRLVSEWRDA